MKFTNILLKDLKLGKANIESVKPVKTLTLKQLSALAQGRAKRLQELANSNAISKIKSVLTYTNIFNNIFLPLLSLYLKFRNNKIYRLFRLVGRIYLLAFIISFLIAVIFCAHDQYSHAVAFIKFQRQIVSEIRYRIESVFNFIRKIVTGYEPKPEPKGWLQWPGLKEYQSKVKDYEKLGKLVEVIQQNPRKSDWELFFNRNLFSESNNWYDFYKSPWFYITVTTIATGALIYYNLDSIKDLGSKIVLPTIVTTVIN
jgi:hypothetical protein